MNHLHLRDDHYLQLSSFIIADFIDDILVNDANSIDCTIHAIHAISNVINLSEVFGNEDDTAMFVSRYIKSTHCDLFFADASILIEGLTSSARKTFFKGSGWLVGSTPSTFTSFNSSINPKIFLTWVSKS